MQIRHVLFISLVCITSLHGADSGGSSDGYQTLWGSMVSKFGPALVTGAGFAWQYIQVSASTTTQLATTAWSFVPAQYNP